MITSPIPPAFEGFGTAPSLGVKLSSPATQEFWEIPVLHEDAHILALNKPALLLVSPDRFDPERPNLMRLLHRDIQRGAPWASARGLSYLMTAHRLDFEASGVLLLAKSKSVLVALSDAFGSEKPVRTYAALIAGSPKDERFEISVPIAPHPKQLGLMRADARHGKRAATRFIVRERFAGYALLECQPLTGRTHQIRAHLRFAGLPLLGDAQYAGKPLLLSHLKPGYRLKEGETEHPLIARPALHAEHLKLMHPVTGAEVSISAPRPKDFLVALKYLRRYASAAEIPSGTTA